MSTKQPSTQNTTNLSTIFLRSSYTDSESVSDVSHITTSDTSSNTTTSKANCNYSVEVELEEISMLNITDVESCYVDCKSTSDISNETSDSNNTTLCKAKSTDSVEEDLKQIRGLEEIKKGEMEYNQIIDEIEELKADQSDNSNLKSKHLETEDLEKQLMKSEHKIRMLKMELDYDEMILQIREEIRDEYEFKSNKLEEKKNSLDEKIKKNRSTIEQLKSEILWAKDCNIAGRNELAKKEMELSAATRNTDLMMKNVADLKEQLQLLMNKTKKIEPSVRLGKKEMELTVKDTNESMIQENEERREDRRTRKVSSRHL